MREIRFRAWFKNEAAEQMLYDKNPGDCLVWKNQGQDIESIMQYTGLKDKNGKEIYEGDIINILGEQELGGGYSFNWNHNAVVKWDENNCCYYLDVIKKYVANICEDGFYTVDLFELRNWSEDEWWIEYEVIGDTHSNPELVKS